MADEGQRIYPWFRLYSKGWLTGTIRADLSIEQRSVWTDLLAMASESRVRGVICRAKGIPYDRAYIANFLGVSLELLNSTIEKGLGDKNDMDDSHRIELDDAGCIVIANWDKYQTTPAEKQKHLEDSNQRELREKRNLRVYSERYPDEAAKIRQEKERHDALQRQAKK